MTLLAYDLTFKEPLFFHRMDQIFKMNSKKKAFNFNETFKICTSGPVEKWEKTKKNFF